MYPLYATNTEVDNFAEHRFLFTAMLHYSDDQIKGTQYPQNSKSTIKPPPVSRKLLFLTGPNHVTWPCILV